MKRIKVVAIYISLGLAAGVPTSFAIPAPTLSIASTNSGAVTLDIANVSTGSTYYIEYIEQLTTNNWQAIGAFEGIIGNTNWITQATNSTGFYRVSADPYHAKVGQSATLSTVAHNVSGTAHIVNNRTIELRNFYYDGGGIVVQVYVSPNTFYGTSGTAISGDLFGTAFNNATLVLDLPESVNLDDVSYISIWCVVAGVSFGDGMFQ